MKIVLTKIVQTFKYCKSKVQNLKQYLKTNKNHGKPI